MMRRFAALFAVGLLIGGVGVSARAQGITGVGSRPKSHVEFVGEPQAIAANKPATVELRFRVENGFHINSHTPKSELLIPTKIAIDDLAGVTLKTVDFPKGAEYSFAFDPSEKLDVYTGEFVLSARVTAKPGNYTLKAALHYQACDNAACYPPKTLPVEASFTAK